MFSTKQRSLLCPTVGEQVTLTRQTHTGLGSIGCEASRVQHDYGCSKEQSCIHRYTPQCRVQVLNTAD